MCGAEYEGRIGYLDLKCNATNQHFLVFGRSSPKAGGAEEARNEWVPQMYGSIAVTGGTIHNKNGVTEFEYSAVSGAAIERCMQQYSLQQK